MRRGVFAIAVACGWACAGAGQRYACDPALGDCGAVVTDGGVQQEAFISAPVAVWHDGAHNGSTDALPFAGALFAAFRHASAWSGDAGAQVLVMRSDDKGKTWQKTAALGVASRDPRQPKLFKFAGKLWIIATFWETADPSKHRTTVRVAASDDGLAWTPFAELENAPGLAAWRPRPVDDKLFLSVWTADELFPSPAPTAFSLLATSDGAAFLPAATPLAGPGAREGELIVRAGGQRFLAVPERSVGSAVEKQTFCTAPKDAWTWTCWSVRGAGIESPAMVEWKGILYVAGKRDTGNGYKRTSIWQVLEEEQDLSPVADVVASFGDTGGPALVQLDEDRALLTFHTTSRLDPRVAALDHEPTEVEAQAHDYATDVLAVQLYMPSAAAGH